MMKTDKLTNIVTEPAVVYYSGGMNVLSIGIPQKDMDMAKEMIDRMGWTIYAQPTAESGTKRKENVKSAVANLTGIISLPDGYDYKKDIAKYLESKYKRNIESYNE